MKDLERDVINYYKQKRCNVRMLDIAKKFEISINTVSNIITFAISTKQLKNLNRKNYNHTKKTL